MAKVGESGREVLFSYTNGGSYVDYIPDKTTPMDSYTFTITTVIGNAEKVQAIVQDNGYATIHDLEEHNKSTNAHRAEFDKKLDVNSRQYVKTIAKHNQGLQVTKGDNSQEITNFITGNYNDADTNKVLNLGTLKGLLGQGAIVVSKLDANAGFVKFANGFTIQWGIGGADNQQKSTVTYPIRFSTVFIVGAMDAFWEGSDTPKYISNSSRESNNTKAVFIGNDQYVGSYYWFALGMA